MMASPQETIRAFSELLNPEIQLVFRWIHERPRQPLEPTEELPRLLDVLRSTNCILRDAGSLHLANVGNEHPAYYEATVRRILNSDDTALVSGAAHSLGYWTNERAAEYLPLLLLFSRSPEDRVRHRGEQGCSRVGSRLSFEDYQIWADRGAQQVLLAIQQACQDLDLPPELGDRLALRFVNAEDPDSDACTKLLRRATEFLIGELTPLE